MTGLIPVERIERKIVALRGHRVMLDSDLADLYDVETGALVRAVKRNPKRFPQDFAFLLTRDESLRCQSGISKGRGGRRYLRHAFTEQGVAMLSSVLHSERAIEANVQIMRAFVRLREIVATQAHLAGKLESLEAEMRRGHRKHEAEIQSIFDAIRRLAASGLPLGAEVFVQGVEAMAGRELRQKRAGRARKKAEATETSAEQEEAA